MPFDDNMPIFNGHWHGAYDVEKGTQAIQFSLKEAGDCMTLNPDGAFL